jgi:ABC-2 type transport system permease protein
MQDPIISDIPVIVVDGDASSLSRTLIRNLDATQALHVTEVTTERSHAEKLLRDGDVVLLLSLEAGLSREISLGGSAHCSVLADGSQLLYAKVAYRSAATTIQAFSTAIQVRRLEALGLSPASALARATPVFTDIHTMENSWFDYAYYLVPGMMMAILQMSASFSALWFFREHRDRDARLLLPRRGEFAAFYLGHGLPLLLANLLALIVLFLLIFPLAGIPFAANSFPLFLRSTLFVLVSIGMGAALSALFGNLVTASQIGLLINAPAFVFSGYTFPRWAMPDGIRVVAELMPLTHLLDGLFPLLIFHEQTWTGLWQLVAFGVLFWGAALLLTSAPGKRLRAWEASIATLVARKPAAASHRS